MGGEIQANNQSRVTKLRRKYSPLPLCPLCELHASCFSGGMNGAYALRSCRFVLDKLETNSFKPTAVQRRHFSSLPALTVYKQRSRMTSSPHQILRKFRLAHPPVLWTACSWCHGSQATRERAQALQLEAKKFALNHEGLAIHPTAVVFPDNRSWVEIVQDKVGLSDGCCIRGYGV